MFNKVDKLVEATMLALQGKLELKESKKAETNYPRFNRRKTEGIDVNIDEKTSVSVEGNETIVDTEDATVIVNKKEDTIVPEIPSDIPMEEPVVDAEATPETDMIEVPADDTIMPEDIIDKPVDTELPTEDEELPLGESKKVENVEIEIKDDGKEVEVKTDNGEEVEVKDETEDEEDEEDTDEEPKESEDTDVLEVPEEDKQEDETMFEENKKVIEGARDIADQINRDEWFNNDKRKQTLRGMLADKIADVAEGLGDDYSEWVSDIDFDDIINDIINSQEWVAFDEKLNEIITEAVEDKVDWTRRDDPASKYYDGDGLDEGKQADQNEEDIKKNKKFNRIQEMIAFRKAKKQESEEIPYDDTTEKTCPKCKKKYTQYPALSRRDNKTYICPDCGTAEAMEDFINNRKKGESLSKLKSIVKNKRLMAKKEEGKKLDEKYSSSTIYTYDVDGTKFEFICRSFETSRSWGHEVELMTNRNTIGVAKCTYYNRTWESFEYQTCMLKAIDKAEKNGYDKDKLNALREQVNKGKGITESKKLEAKEEVKRDTNDLGINEGVPKKEEPVPNTETKVQEGFDRKTFSGVFSTYFKNKYKAVENVEITRIAKTKKGIKVEAKLSDDKGTDRDVCLEFKKIQTGTAFDKFELCESNGIITENKANSKTIMTTTTNKDRYVECRYIIKK